MSPPRILIIEDYRELSDFCRQELTAAGFDVVVAHTAPEGLRLARTEPLDVVVTDLHLLPEDFNTKEGFTIIRELHAAKPTLPIILMTGDDDTNNAIEATKLGAIDFVSKSPDYLRTVRDLRELITRTLAATALVSEPSELGGTAPARDTLVGRSPKMQSVYKAIGRYATTHVTVLIRGETGTGKEMVARALHRHSERPGLFIAVNCTAIPESLLESELFGAEKGAYTGADRLRIGRFEQAQHGTLFLDEIGDMTPSTQVKLLRVLQERTFQRLGGTENIPADVRVMAATHHDLERAITAGRFRQDLYYRLNVATIELPPLRDRREDIPDLVRFFLQRHAVELGLSAPCVTTEALEYLQAQNWTGNVRELENTVCKALLLARGRPVSLPVVQTENRPATPATQRSLGEHITDLLNRAKLGELENAEAALVWDVEYELYRQAIERCHGNLSEAAHLLGVSRPTIREKLKVYGLR